MSDQEWPKVFIYMQDGLRSMGDVVSPHLQQFGDIVSGFADQVDEWGTRFFNGEISLPTIVIEKPRAPPPVPAPFYSRAASWAREHRWLVLAVGTVTGAVAVRLVTLKMRQHTARRRRAPRAANGARREAVLMVGATADAIGKSLTLDLERRGYGMLTQSYWPLTFEVLFCVVSNSHEHDVLEQEGRNHLHVLNLDAQNVRKATISCFNSSALRVGASYRAHGPSNDDLISPTYACWPRRRTGYLLRHRTY